MDDHDLFLYGQNKKQINTLVNTAYIYSILKLMLRLYIIRNNGEGGMISVEDCVEMEIESLKKYVENTNERLIKAEEGEEF